MNKTEKEKMLAGELYLASDEELTTERNKAKTACSEFNLTGDFEILRSLFGSTSGKINIQPTFRCDYGYNISMQDGVDINYNCVILDICKVSIGKNVLIAPNVGIYTATHPTNPSLRLKGFELGKPITICDNVWIGGGVSILPGVTIGENSVIGAGSVVTKDIPGNVVAYGNPCKAVNFIPN
ncbi:MAG: sugar O-acetyltransferase [Ruminococcus sp.]|jgi:maltose O-acetyltransferase|nr:sugar O-acetyltransferase [Ruminococcus sp.]